MGIILDQCKFNLHNNRPNRFNGVAVFVGPISILPIVYGSKNLLKISCKGLAFLLLNSIFMVSYTIFFFFKGTKHGLAGVGGVLS